MSHGSSAGVPCGGAHPVRTPLHQLRGNLEMLIASDPSEAVRSSAILPTLRAAGFALAAYAGAGCALLQPVLMHQIQTFDPADWEHNHRLMTIFREE